MRIYFMVYDDADGENFDMFVQAESPEAAIMAWRGCLSDEGLGMATPSVYAVPAVRPLSSPAAVLRWRSDVELLVIGDHQTWLVSHTSSAPAQAETARVRAALAALAK